MDGNSNFDGGDGTVTLLLQGLVSGKYAVSANLSVMAGGSGQISCSLLDNGTTVDTVRWDAKEAFDDNGIHLQSVMTTTQAKLTCQASVSMQVSNKSIISLPVS